jgi:uncharacterized protein (DUF433 family)
VCVVSAFVFASIGVYSRFGFLGKVLGFQLGGNPDPSYFMPGMVDYRKIITIEPGKRGGKPCIRGIRITVGDVLGWLAAGMSHQEIIDDFPDLTDEDIRACLAYAADKERHSMIAFSAHEAAA